MKFSKIPSFIIPAILIFAGMLFSCKNDPKQVEELSRKDNQSSETAIDIEILYSSSGNIRMKLNAPLLKRYPGDKPYTEFPKGIKVIFYDSIMRPETQLTSQYAINREFEKIMEAKKDVVVINEKGEILNTEHLIWNQETETISTEEFVKITTADEVIMGHGMEADQQFTRYKIKKITGTINIKEED
jgi:LPS export ABC transporter protein LptC